jgi:hypothetical protein
LGDLAPRIKWELAKLADPLGEIESVEASSDPAWETRWGLVITRRADNKGHSLEFTGIIGGRARAEELASTILRQRDYLERSTDASAALGRP